jgi:hypothetical protein
MLMNISLIFPMNMFVFPLQMFGSNLIHYRSGYIRVRSRIITPSREVERNCLYFLCRKQVAKVGARNLDMH